MPDNKEKVARFRGYLLGLNRWTGFRNAHITLREDAIAEVDSHNHVVLQCLDIDLGAMQFRLNDKHKAKPEGEMRREEEQLPRKNYTSTYEGGSVSSDRTSISAYRRVGMRMPRVCGTRAIDTGVFSRGIVSLIGIKQNTDNTRKPQLPLYLLSRLSQVVLETSQTTGLLTFSIERYIPFVNKPFSNHYTCHVLSDSPL